MLIDSRPLAAFNFERPRRGRRRVDTTRGRRSSDPTFGIACLGYGKLSGCAQTATLIVPAGLSMP
eukprot:5035414-Pyramimonas_sp.AAC.1